jgi:OFA family oxalate/formate antiporter-like MFS transporter
MSLPNSQGTRILIATSLISMALGSIHAFSVFLEPLESSTGSSRAAVSSVYSVALIFLTAAVLFGPNVYARLRPATIYLLVATLGAAGLALASQAEGLAFAWIGFSVIFGLANGLGYGFGLQFAARSNPKRAGLAMGIVTAAYALGAVLAPYGFELVMTRGGFPAAMLALGVTVFLVSVAAAVLVARTGITFADRKTESSDRRLAWRRVLVIWVAYGSGVSAGLMAIGHAAGIAAAAGMTGWMAAASIASCNLFGSLLSGWLSDRMPHRFILTSLPLLSAVSSLSLVSLPKLTLPLLGLLGFAYGGTIATYPATIAKLFPGDEGPKAYGRVFTAWGAAGLIAPWLAGQVYDWSGNYTTALWLAALLGIVSATMVRRFAKAV